MSESKVPPELRSHLFVKGKSGNPGGVPKGISRMIRKLVADQRSADRATGIDLDGWERIAMRLFSIAMGGEGANVKDSMLAAKLLFERADGYPKQTADLSVSGPALDRSDVAKLTDEELLELVGATVPTEH